jgi:hypothetical protein
VGFVKFDYLSVGALAVCVLMSISASAIIKFFVCVKGAESV